MLTLKHFKQVCLFIALILSLIWANLLKADDDYINPIADYRFDENAWLSEVENQVIDSSSNEYHARAIGVQPTTRGKICNAADFSNNNASTGDFIELKSDLLNNENKEFTISLWFKTPHSGEIILLSGANASEDNELIWAHETSKKFKPWIDGKAGSNISLNDFSDNLWRHFVWRRNEGLSCFYVNGDKVGCTLGSDVQLYIERLIIGQEQDSLGGGFDPSQRFRGLLDEVLIFDTAISDGQIEAIYNNQNKGLNWDGAQWSKNSCTKIEPVGEYRFDEISWADSVTDNVIDSSDRNNNATAFGVQPSRQSDGKICSAANFDTINTTDYIKLRNELLNGTEQFTISLWLKSDYEGIQPLISGAKNNDAHNEVLWWHNNKKFQLHIRHDYLGNEFAVDDFANGNWQHWVWRRAGKTSCVFLDSVNLGCFASKAGPVSIEALIVGQEQDRLEGGFQSTQRIRGLLDELLIFDEAISDNQIQTIYQNQHAGRLWNEDSSDTPRKCNYAVDHYRLILDDNTGLTCEGEAERLEIQACLNDECSSKYTEQSTVIMNALVDDASGDDITWLNDGVYSFTSRYDSIVISKTEPGKVFYDVYDKTEAKDPFRCFVYDTEVDVSHGCYTEFADAGFKISKISDQIAGTSFTANFEALKKGDGGACENVFEGNQNIKFTYNPILPIAASTMDNAFTINGTAIYSDKDTDTDTEVNVNFDPSDSHKAKLDINYLDAGKISFTASADLPLSESSSGHLNQLNSPSDLEQKLSSTLQDEISASSSAYVVRPREFLIKVDDLPANVTDANSSVFKMAGEAFSFNIEAVNKDGSITTNFNSTEFTGDLNIESNLIVSSNGEEGELDIPPEEQIFSNGIATITNAQFSEVGIIKLVVELHARNYLNHTDNSNIKSDSTNLGRFIPAQFVLTENNVSNDCGEFTYFGQPFNFSYTIEAQNLQGDVVKNYSYNTYQGKSFAKATVENLIENEQHGNHKSANDLTSRYITSTTVNWDEGKYKFTTTNAVLERDNIALNEAALKETSENDPMTKLHPLVAINDPDKQFAGEQYKGLLDLDQNANELGGLSNDFDSKSLIDIASEPLEMRFGRFVVGNSYGSETESLQIPLKVEYWNGTQFSINTLDSCSEYSKSNLNISNMLDEQAIIGTNGTFSLGNYLNDDPGIELSAPNEPRIFRVTYDAPSWFQYDWNGDGVYNDADDNPSGVLQFGMYRGHDRVIYRREN